MSERKPKLHTELCCGYRPWIRQWYAHWLSPMTYFYALKELWQRAFRGYAYSDLWSLDHYLAEWMPSAIEEMRRTSHGYPGRDEADTPEKWDAILVQIRDGFEAAHRIQEDYEYIKDMPTDEYLKWHAEQRAIFDRGIALFSKWYFSLWD